VFKSLNLRLVTRGTALTCGSCDSSTEAPSSQRTQPMLPPCTKVVQYTWLRSIGPNVKWLMSAFCYHLYARDNHQPCAFNVHKGGAQLTKNAVCTVIHWCCAHAQSSLLIRPLKTFAVTSADLYPTSKSARHWSTAVPAPSELCVLCRLNNPLFPHLRHRIWLFAFLIFCYLLNIMFCLFQRIWSSILFESQASLFNKLAKAWARFKVFI
jgi:hypothetical protein